MSIVKHDPVHLSSIHENGKTGLHLTINQNETGILHKMTAVLLVHGWEIQEAVAETCSDGFVKDIFMVKSFMGETMNETLLNRMSDDLDRLFNEELTVAEYVEKSETPRAGSAGNKKVDIYNPVTIDYTLVDVKVDDRPGLLFDIATCLFDAGLDIISFTANSSGSFVRDSFLILDARGRKVEDGEEIARLKESIISVL